METIKWIKTPRCSDCTGPYEFRRRRCCMGCEKIFRSKCRNNEKIPKRRLSRTELDARNAGLMKLYNDGHSYQKLALMFNMPRATVQSAVRSAKKSGDMSV